MIGEFYEFLDQRGLVGAFEDYKNYLLSSDINPTLYLRAVDFNNTQEELEFWAGVSIDWNNYLQYWEEDLGKEWYLKEEYNGH